jgi:hypothetical protein
VTRSTGWNIALAFVAVFIVAMCFMMRTSPTGAAGGNESYVGRNAMTEAERDSALRAGATAAANATVAAAATAESVQAAIPPPPPVVVGEVTSGSPATCTDSVWDFRVDSILTLPLADGKTTVLRGEHVFVGRLDRALGGAGVYVVMNSDPKSDFFVTTSVMNARTGAAVPGVDGQINGVPALSPGRARVASMERNDSGGEEIHVWYFGADSATEELNLGIPGSVNEESGNLRWENDSTLVHFTSSNKALDIFRRRGSRWQ